MRKPWEEVNQEGASTKKIKAPGKDGEARVGTRESEEEGGCVSPPGLCVGPEPGRAGWHRNPLQTSTLC